MAERKPGLSVVVPAHNEEANLGPLVEELVAVLEKLGEPHEIVVVDDGSNDASPRRPAELSRRFPALVVVRLAERSGQTAAFAAGFHSARGETVVTMDADLQNNPADIPRLLECLATHDVVCGIRRHRHDSWLRRLSSRIANSVRRAVIHDSITDIGCSLKVFPRAALVRLPLFDGLHRFLPALLEWEGSRVCELEVDHRPRRAGVSKYNVRNRMFRALADLLAVRWMKSRRLHYEIKK